MSESAKPKLAEGFKCKKCGKEHRYPAYVYAHWDISLTHDCECGAQHEIRRGQATLVDVCG